MNLKETVELIGQTAVKAAGTRVIKIDGDARTVLIETNGAVVDRKLPPPLRSHVVDSLDDLVAMAGAVGGKCELWHNEESVILILDSGDRRERATLTPDESSVWRWLKQCGSGSKYNQRELISLIRTKLADAIAPDELANLLTSLRSVTFRRRDEGSSEVERGRDALGKSVEQECAGIDKLPEYLVVTTPVYRNIDDLPEATIKLLIEVDFESQSFVLRQIGDAIAKTARDTQAALGEKLSEHASKTILVYQGTP